MSKRSEIAQNRNPFISLLSLKHSFVYYYSYYYIKKEIKLDESVCLMQSFWVQFYSSHVFTTYRVTHRFVSVFYYLKGFLRTVSVIEMAPPWWVTLTCFDTETQISPHIYLSHCSTLYIVHSPCQNVLWSTFVSHHSDWVTVKPTDFSCGLEMAETISETRCL